MSMPEPPPPLHILRGHTSSITALYVTSDNERIYSGDASGHANCTSTQTLRPILSWKPHDDGVLGVEEYGQAIVTQGRDNKLHVWQRAEEVSKIGGSAALAESRTPTLKYSLDVNALNYCRFSLFVQDSTSEENEFLLAVPNLVESSEADIWCLPSCQRLHAAIGKEKGKSPILSTDGRGAASNGIIMSLHLFSRENILHVLIAYENGTVTLRTSDRAKSVEGLGWEVVWSVKLHVEAIMAMTVSLDHTMAFTVSADHLVGRYSLLVSESQSFRIKQAGNSSITVREDGKVCAVGGWDGKIRLFSTKNFKPLGTLKYHKEGCQAVTFTRLNPRSLPLVDEEDDDDDDLEESEKEERARWLVAGAKDKLISIWSLMSFQKQSN